MKEARDKLYEEWRVRAEMLAGKGTRAVMPQPGFQFDFLSSSADICIGGGSAGGGKTYALLMEPTRHRHIADFAAMVFRRQIPEIINPGGLWDEALKLYAPTTGGFPIKNPRTWFFPHPENNLQRGARVVFTHLQHTNTVMRHHGGQYPLIMFDELSTFEASQFWYMLSRNRSDIGIRSYSRATTNPDSSGWLKKLIGWWLYPDDYPDEHLAGYARPERVGKIRYLFRESEVNHWGDSVQELINKFPEYFRKDDPIRPRDKVKSVTFIPGSVYDNRKLLSADPGYIANLMAQSTAERNRLLYGCWRYIPGSDDLFDYNATEDLFTNDFIPEEVQSSRKFITADIALEGADKFVVVVWYGWVAVKAYVYAKIKSDRVLTVIREVAQKHGVPARNIAYDRDGVGDYISGFFKTAYGFRGNATPLKYSPPKARGSKAKDDEKPPNYENLRSQVYYEFAKITERAECYLRMPPQIRALIIEELNATKKASPSSSGKLRIIPKAEVAKKIGRSPDWADAIVMRFVFEMGIPKRGRRSRSSAG